MGGGQGTRRILTQSRRYRTMLIIVIGPAATGLDILADPLPAEPCVAVLLPGTATPRDALSGLLDRCYVLEYLTMPACALAILDEVCHRLGHLFETADGPMVFVNRNVTRDEVIEITRNATHVPSNIAAEYGSDGSLVQLTIGAQVMANPLLPRFIRMLQARGLDDSSITLLEETFGGVST